MTDVIAAAQAAQTILLTRYSQLSVMPRYFLPEDKVYTDRFGAVGAGIDCRPHIQAAIDDASAAGGGIVMLNGNYGQKAALTPDGKAAYAFLNQYATRYSLLVQHDNVFIFGTGTLTLLEKPPASVALPQYGLPAGVAAFSTVAFGYPSLTPTPINLMPVVRNVGIGNGARVNGVIVNGLHFNAPNVLTADLAALNSSLSGVVVFANCQNFKMRGVNIVDGFGHTGIITTHAAARLGEITDCDVTGRYTLANPAQPWSWNSIAAAGIECDGGQQIVVSGNRVNYSIAGIVVNCNADNQVAPEGMMITNNDLNEVSTAFAMTGGKWSTIAGNRLTTVRGGNFCQIIATLRVESGGAITYYPSVGVSVTDNVATYNGPVQGVRSGVGMYVQSKTTGGTNDDSWHDHARNVYNRFVTALRLDSVACHDIRSQGNTYGGANVVYDDPNVLLPQYNNSLQVN